MPDTTPNYGWRIPKADGTDYIIPDDVRLPVGSIDTQMKVEENARLANTNILNGLGLWVDATGIVVCIDTGAANIAIAGSSISVARYMKIGKTVFYQGYGSSGTASAVCCIALPNAQAGVPKQRSFNCGSYNINGATAPATATGVGYMSADLTRIVPTNSTNGYLSVPTGNSLRWNLVYEVV